MELTTEAHVRLAARINLETLEMYLLRERDARRTTIEISKRDIPIASLRLDEALELGRAWMLESPDSEAPKPVPWTAVALAVDT